MFRHPVECDLTGKRPTIDDVARVSGVARVTVSRVLNGGPNVRDEVRTRVTQAIEQLDYKVNPQARSLAGGASRLLAFVFASDLENDPNSYYESALELGALRACLTLGYQVLVQNVPQQTPDREKRVLDLITSQRCEGLILSPPYSDDVSLIQAALAQGCKVVTVSPGGPGRGIADGVGVDMARELLRLGHRRFGFIAGLEGHLSADRRMKGFERALAEQGLGDDAWTMVRGDFTFRSGTHLAPGLLDHPLNPSALVCANDDMAAGALSAAHARGLSIPRDLSITGFDDAPVAAIVWPPLTTVHQPVKVLGQRAVEMLVARLNGTNTSSKPVFQQLEHAVVSRQTTAAR
jgi:LacI family transcriptional regulator